MVKMAGVMGKSKQNKEGEKHVRKRDLESKKRKGRQKKCFIE